MNICLRFSICLAMVLAGSSLCCGQSFGLEPKTVPAIIATLQARGEQVTTIAQVFEPSSNITWVVIQREAKPASNSNNPSTLNYTLIKSIVGADVVTSSPNLINTIQQFTNLPVAKQIVSDMLDQLIEDKGGLPQFESYLQDNPQFLQNASQLVKTAVTEKGIPIQ